MFSRKKIKNDKKWKETNTYIKKYEKMYETTEDYFKNYQQSEISNKDYEPNVTDLKIKMENSFLYLNDISEKKIGDLEIHNYTSKMNYPRQFNLFFLKKSYGGNGREPEMMKSYYTDVYKYFLKIIKQNIENAKKILEKFEEPNNDDDNDNNDSGNGNGNGGKSRRRSRKNKRTRKSKKKARRSKKARKTRK